MSSANDIVRIKSIGINRASTFRGFCQKHDKEIFEPIEDHALQLTQKHLLLLNYRSLSKEMYYFIQLLANYKRWFVDPHSDDPNLYGMLARTLSVQTGSFSWLMDFTQWTEMRDALKNSNFSQTFYFAFEFDRAPDILTCAAIPPTTDVYRNELQVPFNHHQLDTISISLLPYQGSKGVAIFAWHGNSKVNELFIKALQSVPCCDVPDTIVRFLFHNVKDIYFSPRWWSRLTTEAQESLSQRLLHAFRGRPACYTDSEYDGHKYVDWNVTGVKTNLKL